MRATTLSMLYISRATRAEMMFELSPLETAANASASLIPASSSTPRSKPMPVTVMPLKSGPSRRNASALMSMTDVSCPRSSRLRARVDPTRPHPMSTMCTTATLLWPGVRVVALPLVSHAQGPLSVEAHPEHRDHWLKVMCLTGVDYFSTLGYQPGIAALAAGTLAPLATVVLVLLTLFGAVPVYRRVASESPHGQGSISMLQRLLPFWRGKLFVLTLLGFAATSWVITITLSAADATAHIVENPLMPEWLEGKEVWVTCALIAGLGAVFLRGFTEAVGVAVMITVTYMSLNAIVIVVAFMHVFAEPHVVTDWTGTLSAQHGNPVMMAALALILFPKLALGMSGFETGVAVMTQVRGDSEDTDEEPLGRIRNTKKLLVAAAVIMSVYLIASSLVTTWLIPAEAFERGGQANGRA